MDVHEAGILDNKTLGQPTGLTRDEVFYFQNVTFQVCLMSIVTLPS